MKNPLPAVLLALLPAVLLPHVAIAAPAGTIESRTAVIEGESVHYLAAGEGEALILLHGYTQTSRMWRPVIPLFAQKFRVIAPDLPGIGDSAIPANGMNMLSAAVRIHALAESLGIKKARVVGHDIGLMVAYAYAAQFPEAVDKLVVMDAFLPGVVGWETLYNNPAIWHFRFVGTTPEALVHGRERIYFEHYWNDFAADPQHSIPEVDREAYTAAYSRPGRMRAGWLYFASWPGTANAIGQLSQHPLTMPVLSIGGEKANGAFLAQQMKVVATDTYGRHSQRHRALGDGGAAQGDHRRTDAVPVSHARCEGRSVCNKPVIGDAETASWHRHCSNQATEGDRVMKHHSATGRGASVVALALLAAGALCDRRDVCSGGKEPRRTNLRHHDSGAGNQTGLSRWFTRKGSYARERSRPRRMRRPSPKPLISREPRCP